MVILKSAYKFGAYPSKEQKTILNRRMSLSKQLYNLLLEKSQQHFGDMGKAFTKYDMTKRVTKFKKEHPEYNGAYSQVLQNVPDRLPKAYKNVFGGAKDRDLNASINILKRAREGHSRSHASGDSVPTPRHGDASRIVESGTALGVSR
ncbi:helix-turn-helix domain-containing protein [Candidatus Marsarchaeota archaeon]|nr:helix-turn-helix domain-containing protein [Candidatus Marsarchaeota archaeon]